MKFTWLSNKITGKLLKINKGPLKVKCTNNQTSSSLIKDEFDTTLKSLYDDVFETSPLKTSLDSRDVFKLIGRDPDMSFEPGQKTYDSMYRLFKEKMLTNEQMDIKTALYDVFITDSNLKYKEFLINKISSDTNDMEKAWSRLRLLSIQKEQVGRTNEKAPRMRLNKPKTF